MYNNWGYGTGFGLGWIFMVIFWSLIIWGIVVLIQNFSRNSSDKYYDDRNNVNEKKNSAINILDERYAKGEIDKVEYEEKKKDLKS